MKSNIYYKIIICYQIMIHIISKSKIFSCITLKLKYAYEGYAGFNIRNFIFLVLDFKQVHIPETIPSVYLTRT